jgi:hypothetical protein
MDLREVEKMKDLQCQHKRQQELYGYKINDDQTLFLCAGCNMNLARRLLGQLSDEVFCYRVLRGDKNDNRKETKKIVS